MVDRHWSSGEDRRAQWKHELFAALCSCPPAQRATALVFRRSAATLWGLDGLEAVSGAPLELAVTSGRPGPGCVLLRRPLKPAERSNVQGFPVTSVCRTLLDLGQVVGTGVLERALECALRKRYVTVQALMRALGEVPNRRGTHDLRALLRVRPAGLPPTESDAETLFVQLARSAGLPPPERQFVVRTPNGAFRLDFAWPEVRVAAEIDGAATHASPGALARDLRRQNSLMLAPGAAGWTLLRFSWPDLVVEPFVNETVRKLCQAWSIGLSRPRFVAFP